MQEEISRSPAPHEKKNFNEPANHEKKNPSTSPSSNDCGFSNEEMRTAFEFLDLDKNGFIGAAELRHILVGMGELVTDEEIDMMIRMLDANGNGQVTVEEFMAMVSSPDASRDEDFEPTRENITQQTDNKSENATANDNDEDKEPSVKATEAEMQKREIKRTLLSVMVSSRTSGIPYRKERLLKIAQDIVRFSEIDKGSRQWRVGNIEDIVKNFALGSVESQELFHAFEFKMNQTKLVDLRQILMGMTNFIPTVSTEEKCRLAFDFYDEHKSGFLTLDEIEQVLVGSHLYQRRSAVQSKAKVVMSSADAHHAGGIRFEELLQVSTKFPNLVFPAGAFRQLG